MKREMRMDVKLVCVSRGNQNGRDAHDSVNGGKKLEPPTSRSSRRLRECYSMWTPFLQKRDYSYRKHGDDDVHEVEKKQHSDIERVSEMLPQIVGGKAPTRSKWCLVVRRISEIALPYFMHFCLTVATKHERKRNFVMYCVNVLFREVIPSHEYFDDSS